MYLKHLRVSGFRNLAEQSIDFSPGITFISGKNGEGKTNLLEAIYVLSLSKSYRTSKRQELIQWDTQKAAVFGIVSDALNEVSLAVGIEKGSRNLFVNGTKVPSVLEYLGYLTTITFSPSDLALVKGAPSLRRKFLDKHINDLNPKLMRHFLSFNKALAHKSALLREGRADFNSLDSWNVIMAQSAYIISEERKSLVSKLQAQVNQVANRIGAVDGDIEIELESNIRDEVFQNGWKGVFEFLRKASSQEKERKRVLFGPHRDEMIIKLHGTDSRAFASQGQTRSLVLSLKFALLEIIEEEKGESPVLLLDDVDSELDEERRQALLQAIFSKERQVIITGTDYSTIKSQDADKMKLMSLRAGGVLS